MLLLAVMCVACNPDSGKKKISIAYANWLEGIAMSHLAKVVLEEKGYEVEFLPRFPVRRQMCLWMPGYL